MTLKQIAEDLYQLNAAISLCYIATQKPIPIDRVEYINKKIGEAIKKLRSLEETGGKNEK